MRFILPKGRLFDSSISLIQSSGIEIAVPEGRTLVSRNGENEILLAKPSDVPTYVERTGDIGIAGNDVTEELGSDVFIPLRLGFGKCRISVSVPLGQSADISSLDGKSIATKYPGIASRFFFSMGVEVTIVKLSGSIELAPSIGIADAIMDIVETGSTLKENGLLEAFKVMDVQAQIIVNRISLKTRYDEISEILDNFGKVVTNGQ